MDVSRSGPGGEAPGPGAIYVVTGERGAGKSTVCVRVVRDAARRGLAVAGVLTLPVSDRRGGAVDEQGPARRVIDLATGSSRDFGSRPPAASQSGESDPLTPGWEYDRGVFAWGNEALGQATPCGLLVVDEIGPLELLGGRGWVKALEALRSRDFRAALVVCRPGLLEQLAVSLSSRPVAVFEVSAQTRDSLPSTIGHLFQQSASTP